MCSRNLFVTILSVCFLAAGLGGAVSVANAASAGQSFSNPSLSAENNVIQVKRYSRGHRIVFPIVPYIAYDYPYYYSRGFYPKHIGPGYIYNNYHVVEADGYDGAAEETIPHSAKQRCAERFLSFEWDTGLYTTYRGHKRLCPYLR